MATQVGSRMIAVARRTDLYGFLSAYHGDEFNKEGQTTLQLKSNPSVKIKCGYSGYYDFGNSTYSRNERDKRYQHGNAIDFLMAYMGYNFLDAVSVLCEYNNTPSDASESPDDAAPYVQLPPAFPARENGPYKRLYAYLRSRGISKGTIKMLIDAGLMYESQDSHNIVFVSRDKDFGDLKGTYTYGDRQFRGVVARSRSDGYWAFGALSAPQEVYICEASVDAISLYELHRRQGRGVDGCMYASICGSTGKQQAIDRLRREYRDARIILATDNDAAGEEVRNRNSDLEAVIPTAKDWSDDLTGR